MRFQFMILYCKKFVELNENIKIKVLIKNFGKNIENNLNVSLYINNIYYNSIILNNLNINELKEIEFNYAPTNIGENTIKIEVQSIPGELFKSNNQLSRNLKVFEKIKGRIKALVLDSWGVDYSGYSIFDELNENWFDYGDYLINRL